MTDQTNYIYQTIVSDMSEGLMVIGFDGIITHLNSAAEQILDKNEKDLIGKKFAKCFFLYEENDQFNQAILDAIYDKNKSHRNIVSYYNGNNFKELSITTSFLHNNGSKVGIVIVLNDITELVELRDSLKAMEQIKKLNSQLELRNKLLSATFGRFLSDEIVKELLETPGGLQIGGKKRHITVMMSDLRGFTQMSESLDPTQLIDMLNHYLTVMSDIITEHKGTIIEFLGDGILVIFGAPIANKNHALDSVIAAIKMQKAMPSINKWNLQQGYPSLSMGIGINTGEMIVGNIGSEKHTRYGVIGKHVNLCGRIESYSVGGQVLISPLTKSLINEPLEIANEFEVIPKGIQEPILLSDICGIGGNYDIHCPKILEEPKELEKSIDIEFYQIFEKKVSNIPMQGIVKALSKNCAIISTNFELMPFDNFEIRLKKNVYFKVISKKETGFLIVFTSDSSYLTQS
jgi:adenylate cyclase